MNTQDSNGLAEVVETKLWAALEDQDFDSLRIGPLLQDYRELYSDLVLKNCEDALRTNIEDKLWEAHVQINGRFRMRLGYFRNLKGKKKPVEQRKAAHLYLRFLKISQRFYRGHIQRLVTQSRGIGELTAVAQKFSLNGASETSDEDSQMTPDLRHAILQLCHNTLIHLGDLSRYRESELVARDAKRNWEPAIGYYDLANAINPSSGTPHNQLAIIARIEGNPTRTLYHLYRAQIAYEPPPTAADNLDLELKKLRGALKPADFAVSCSDPTGSPSAGIQRSFPLLHSCCFGATVLQEYNDLEDRVLQYLCRGLKERTLSTETLNMIVLSNIAADFIAGDRWQAEPEEDQNEHAFESIQRLNVRTFSSLLQLLGDEYRNRAQEGSKLDAVTSTVRRLLPSLRYYSAWLIFRAGILSVHLGDSAMDQVVKEFWAIYAETTSLLSSVSEVNGLPRLDYLLEEDADIIGFRHLQEVQLERKPSVLEAFMRRTKHCDVGLTRASSDVEMRCRIRDFLEDSLELIENDCVPINFLGDERRFTVMGDLIDSAPTRNSATRPSNHLPCPDTESTTDGTTSQEASEPILQKVVQIDEDFITHESSNNMAPPLSNNPTSNFPSTQNNTANETSYAIGNSTLTALRQGPQPQRTSEHTSTPASQQQQQIVSHAISVKSTPSEISEMPEPTQQAPPQREMTLPRLHPARIIGGGSLSLDHWRRHEGFLDDMDFNSSNVFPDSSDCIRRRPGAADPTPPNGQGG